MQHWDACRVSGQREHQKPDDAIHVFLNYKKVGKFKTRLEAVNFCKKLINESPTSLDDLKDYLLT